MTDSSFGPCPDPHGFRTGCRSCYDENEHRKRGFCFGTHPRMVNAVCGHRLHPFRKMIPEFKLRLLWRQR